MDGLMCMQLINYRAPMQKEPILVTVLMPVYNGQDFLKEAIESILNQTYVYLEVLIINDGSIDASEEIILSYTDDRIVYLKHKENKGLINTLNSGLSLSKGKYIARMDADDISLPSRIEKQLFFLESNFAVGLVGSAVTVFGDRDEFVVYPRENEDLQLASLFYNPFCHPSVMIRKQIIDDNKLSFKKEYLHAEEYKLWTEFLVVTKCHNLQDNLLMYRSHPSQISQVYQDIQLDKAKLIQMEYLEKAGFELTEREFESVFCQQDESNYFNSSQLLLRLQTLEKLVVQNKKNLFFNAGKLLRIFSLLYKNSILEQPGLNRSIYEHYKSSRLSSAVSWTMKQKLSIFMKLILK